MQSDHPTPPADHWLAKNVTISQDGIQSTTGIGQNNTVLRQPAQPWVQYGGSSGGGGGGGGGGSGAQISLPPPKGGQVGSLWTNYFIGLGLLPDTSGGGEGDPDPEPTTTTAPPTTTTAPPTTTTAPPTTTTAPPTTTTAPPTTTTSPP
jgi:hypothetical protein